MNHEAMKKWIDGASYEALLSKWRFEPVGSPWFSPPISDYYVEAMKRKSAETKHEDKVAASKGIGWTR